MASDGDSFSTSFTAAWDALVAAGALRNPHYRAAKRRALVGGLVAQYDPAHLVSKRPSSFSGPIQVVHEFNASGFHFLRIDPRKECVCTLGATAAVAEGDPLDENLDVAAAVWHPHVAGDIPSGAHFLVVNVSPLWEGHCLFVPSPGRLLPQVLTRQALATALSLLAAVPARDFRVGFNSLGGWASVSELNRLSRALSTRGVVACPFVRQFLRLATPFRADHLHFHVGFMTKTFPGGGFPIEESNLRELASASVPAPAEASGGPGLRLSVATTTDWPLPTIVFCAQNESGVDDTDADPPLWQRRVLSAVASTLIDAALAGNTAHNVLFAARGRRVYVILRALQPERGGGPAEGAMAVALAECCGLAVTYSDAACDAMDATEFARLLAAAALPGPDQERLEKVAIAAVRGACERS